jgi:DNA polymerase III delta subunit
MSESAEMITVLVGDDRERLWKTLPEKYTTLDAESLTAGEVLEPLLSTSLFGESEVYLVKDADKNAGFLAELEKSAGLVAANAEVFIQFEKLARNKKLYKVLVETPSVTIVEYKKFVDNSTNFNILPAALSGNRREALRLLKKSQMEGNEPILVLGAMNYKLAEALVEAHRVESERLPELQKIGQKFLAAREILLAGVMDPWLYLATLLTDVVVGGTAKQPIRG